MKLMKSIAFDNTVEYGQLRNLFVVSLFSLLFISLQLAADYDQLFFFSYWIIPDSVTHYELTRGFVRGEFEIGDFRSSAAVPLYFSIFFKAGILGFLFANVLLLSVCIRYFGYSVLYVALILYPHYLQLLILPSKDLLILVFYFLVVFCLINDKFLIAIPLSVCSFFVRDAAMLILLSFVIAAALVKKTNVRPLWIAMLSLLMGIFLFHVIEKWGQEFFIVSRNSAALNEISSENLRNLPFGIAYLARIIFNLTNMAFRLPFVDDLGCVSVASIFMFISGMSSLVCCGVASRNLLISKSDSIQLVSLFYFISLYLISLNPFVQGRYQLPMAIVSSVILFKGLKFEFLLFSFGLVFFLSLIARFFYINSGFGIPDLEVNLVDLWTLVAN
jgi:hypothetical protein